MNNTQMVLEGPYTRHQSAHASRRRWVRAQRMIDSVVARIQGAFPFPPAEEIYLVVKDGGKFFVVLDEGSEE